MAIPNEITSIKLAASKFVLRFAIAAFSLVGLTPIADNHLNKFTDIDLGLRGAIEEPFDIFNHGTSIGYATLVAASVYKKRMAGLILGDNIKQRDEFDPLSSVRNSIQPSILAGISVTSAAMLAIESGSGLIGAWQRLGSEFSADTDPYLASLRFDYLDIVYGITTGLITAMLYAKFDLEKALSETALSETALSEKALSEKALSEKVKSDNSKMITEQPAANRPLGISEDLVAQSIPEAKSLGLN